jgi:hypothetical protein
MNTQKIHYDLRPLKPLNRPPSIKEKTFDEIYELFEHRLNVIGDIRANDIWLLCRFKTRKGYCTITTVFRMCITTMIEQKKAVRVRQGVYKILKPNTPQFVIRTS